MAHVANQDTSEEYGRWEGEYEWQDGKEKGSEKLYEKEEEIREVRGDGLGYDEEGEGNTEKEVKNLMRKVLQKSGSLWVSQAEITRKVPRSDGRCQEKEWGTVMEQAEKEIEVSCGYCKGIFLRFATLLFYK